MQFINRTKLQVALVEHGMKIKDLADELCITYPACWNKVHGHREFNENDMYVLSHLFGTVIFCLSEVGSKTIPKSKKRKHG